VIVQRLRMAGFKSFVDATDLEIAPGLTGIVGPNGCGKSNVLESLRWVMGATSAKALRGEGMDDVIFSGTSNRPARNMAEVCLTLDNSQRKAPTAFNDSDTLEVVRRIERDAGSAYRINGKDVRARDVQLLFADASTGATSPALVRQGQVAELINAKPESRRKLLESAAGITGLHSRRHEAELRLRAAETNLQRLDDVQQQLEDQLAGLKRQARQATRYKTLSGLIRSAESLTFHLKWQDALVQVQSLEQKLKQIEAEIETAARHAAEASTRQTAAAEKIPPLREAEAGTAAAVQRLRLEIDTLAKEEDRALNQAETIRAQIAQIASDIQREHGLRRDAETALEKLRDEDSLIRAEQGDEGCRIEEAEKTLAETRDDVAREEDRLDRLTREKAEWEARRQSCEQALRDLNSRAAKLTSQLQQNAQELAQVAAAMPKDFSEPHARAEIEQAEADCERLQADMNAAESDRAEAERQVEAARPPHSEAESDLNKLKAEAKALSDLLNVNAGGLWPPVIDALKVRPGYEPALAAALGEDLNAPTDEAAPVHWDLIDRTISTPLPDGAQPLSRFVDGPAQLARRLSQIGIVDVQDGPRLMSHLAPGQRLVTLAGDLWRWDGFTASADAETPAAKRLAQRNRLRQLDQELQAAATRVEAAAAALKRAKDNLQEQTDRWQTCRAQSQAADQKLARLRRAKTEADEANANLRSRQAALAEAKVRIETDLAEAQSSLARQEAERAKLSGGQELQDKISRQRASVQELRANVAMALNLRDKLQRESEGRARRLIDIANEQQQWQARVASAEQRIENLKDRKSKAQWDLQSAEEIPQQIAGKRLTLGDAIEAAEQKRSAAADALSLAETTLGACDKQVRQADAALGSLREERARIETALEAGRERLKDIVGRIQETLKCSPEKLLDLADHNREKDLPALEDIESKMNRLKNERERMGAVNLRAEEESRELQDRLDELLSERDDLEQAIGKLRRSISTLNQEGRARLKEAFDRVNAEFTRHFEILFDDGTARLELTDLDDPLAAGLEIHARPPGKRIQSMSLLSGGEQALTAMALILAVFMSNPAPICFLDEVDAPLDDSNVERFCKLLHDMKQQSSTKFIVITHHALTMANMDRLYGVTMAERGVSQLVSVDLAEAEQIREAG